MNNLDDLSIIVIAYNEEFAVNKCLKSIEESKLSNAEIICVDSGSEDETVNIMKSYKAKLLDLKVLQIKGSSNASVVRNVGLKFASRKNIFFVDGDVELNPDFVFSGLEIIKSGRADAVVGELSEIVYSTSNDILKPLYTRRKFTNERNIKSAGGIFLTTREVVDRTGLWDENYYRGQDIEYTLRCSRHHNIIAIPLNMGIHHTRHFNKRSIDFVKKGYPILTGMLFRENLGYINNLKELARITRGPLTGVLFYGSFVTIVILSTFVNFSGFYLLMVIPLFILLTDLIICLIKKRNLFNYVVENYLFALLIIAGFFFNRRSTIHYQINNIV